MLLQIIKNSTVIDLFVVPDYTTIFRNCGDNKFARYCKGEQTQHQFIMEAVPVCAEFPLGCKTTYRAYASDKVMELVKGENDKFADITVYPRQCEVLTYPLAEPENNISAGLKILYFGFLY